MRPFNILCVLISTAVGLAASAHNNVTDLEPVGQDSIPTCSEEYLIEDAIGDGESDIEVGCSEFDALVAHNETNLAVSPFPILPKLLKIGYGTQWKKGLQHWVAFPMLGLVACKKYVDLGRVSVGQKHGACQASFEISGKWYQLDGCNPTTGMPKYLLDENGYAITSCAKKNFKVLCLKEGKISGKGSCEDEPPVPTLAPTEPGSLFERDVGDDMHI